MVAAGGVFKLKMALFFLALFIVIEVSLLAWYTSLVFDVPKKAFYKESADKQAKRFFIFTALFPFVVVLIAILFSVTANNFYKPAPFVCPPDLLSVDGITKAWPYIEQGVGFFILFIPMLILIVSIVHRSKADKQERDIYTRVIYLILVYILATITAGIFVSFAVNTGRSKSVSSSIKANMSGFRSYMELYHDSFGMYPKISSTGVIERWQELSKELSKEKDHLIKLPNHPCFEETKLAKGQYIHTSSLDGSQWMIRGYMPVDKNWCVDHLGHSQEISLNGDNSNFDCSQIVK
ncbi:MAG: hypothetical protein AAB367_04260 [Patescibacteria group bacterium]